ncbi:MAG: restriction endonuclease subunit R, partial [Elusimicrobia bacterium]|nr:restriction endonuclease subunit R [Elusimicrobiota bacterium]
LRYFGEPVYEYDVAQGIEDGYLAACEIIRRDIFLDQSDRAEQEAGVERPDLEDKELVDATTGQRLDTGMARARYEATSFEDRLLLPDRVKAMCQDLFKYFLETGGPEQKTIIFCARDRHADDVAVVMNNLYADWCSQNSRSRLDPYAFKCTASVGGAQYLADLRGASRSHFVATTVDLLTTGVDVPVVKNIVFFKYVASPIAFYQMVGRGTRLDAPTGKLMFRVYDYTNASRLFGQDFITRIGAPKGPGGDPPPEPPGPTIRAHGFDVRVTDAGRYILTQMDGKAMPVTIEEYKERLAAKLVEEAPTIEAFRSNWIVPSKRKDLLTHLPDAGRSALVIQQLEEMEEYDLYDVLAELGYGLAPRTREGRAQAFTYKHKSWLGRLPDPSRMTLLALVAQFARTGTEGLENPQIFQTPEVSHAGGLSALKALGKPAEILQKTKQRIFAA